MIEGCRGRTASPCLSVARSRSTALLLPGGASLLDCHGERKEASFVPSAGHGTGLWSRERSVNETSERAFGCETTCQSIETNCLSRVPHAARPQRPTTSRTIGLPLAEGPQSFMRSRIHLPRSRSSACPFCDPSIIWAKHLYPSVRASLGESPYMARKARLNVASSENPHRNAI